MLFQKRARFENVSSYIGKLFSAAPVSPNQWTALAFLPAVLCAYLLLNGQFLLAASMLLLTGFVDMIDGAVARATGKASKKGAYIDTIADRYTELIILIPFLFIPLPAFFLPAYAWVFLYLAGGMMTTYAKAAAAEKGLGEIKGGMLERAERLLLLTAGIVLGSFSRILIVYVIAVAAIMANISALQRIFYALGRKNL